MPIEVIHFKFCYPNTSSSIEKPYGTCPMALCGANMTSTRLVVRQVSGSEAKNKNVASSSLRLFNFPNSKFRFLNNYHVARYWAMSWSTIYKAILSKQKSTRDLTVGVSSIAIVVTILHRKISVYMHTQKSGSLHSSKIHSQWGHFTWPHPHWKVHGNSTLKSIRNRLQTQHSQP